MLTPRARGGFGRECRRPAKTEAFLACLCETVSSVGPLLVLPSGLAGNNRRVLLEASAHQNPYLIQVWYLDIQEVKFLLGKDLF